jgi:hypothetical protein
LGKIEALAICQKGGASATCTVEIRRARAIRTRFILRTLRLGIVIYTILLLEAARLAASGGIVLAALASPSAYGVCGGSRKLLVAVRASSRSIVISHRSNPTV